MSLLIIKVAPALVAGNTVVAKAAPTAPLTTLEVRGTTQATIINMAK